jgi:hypothetical protein
MLKIAGKMLPKSSIWGSFFATISIVDWHHLANRVDFVASPPFFFFFFFQPGTVSSPESVGFGLMKRCLPSRISSKIAGKMLPNISMGGTSFATISIGFCIPQEFLKIDGYGRG